MATICLIYSIKPSASWPTQQLVSFQILNPNIILEYYV